MNPSVVPHEMLAHILDRHLKGKSSRDISAWLKKEHGVTASHRAVLGCLQRAAAEKRAMEDLIDEPAAAPPGSTPEARLVQLDHDLLRLARRAMSEGDTKTALKARIAQVQIAGKQLQQERHADRLKRLDKRLDFHAEVQPIPVSVPEQPSPEVLGTPEVWREPTREELAAQEERENEEFERWEAKQEGRVYVPRAKKEARNADSEPNGSTVPPTVPRTIPKLVTP